MNFLCVNLSNDQFEENEHRGAIFFWDSFLLSLTGKYFELEKKIELVNYSEQDPRWLRDCLFQASKNDASLGNHFQRQQKKMQWQQFEHVWNEDKAHLNDFFDDLVDVDLLLFNHDPFNRDLDDLLDNLENDR